MEYKFFDQDAFQVMSEKLWDKFCTHLLILCKSEVIQVDLILP